MTKKSCMQLNLVGYSIVILLVLCTYHPRGSSSSSCSIGALQFFFSLLLVSCFPLACFFKVCQSHSFSAFLRDLIRDLDVMAQKVGVVPK